MSLERPDRDQFVRRYEDLSTSYARYESEPGTLNREFVDPFETAREKYGGGACRSEDHAAVERPALLTLVGMGSDEVSARTVRLGEGDVASVDAGPEPFRVKVYGQRAPTAPSAARRESSASGSTSGTRRRTGGRRW